MTQSLRTRRALAELARRRAKEARFDPERGLFGEQKRFVLDRSRLALASCSRRAGKTHGIAWKLVDKGLEFPRSLLVYIHQARERAKDTLWPALQDLDTAYELGLRFKENTGEVILPNGSRIGLFGGGSKREFDKLRGIKSPLIGLDEAQGYPGPLLKYAFRDVLQPATMDYGKDGQIIMTGTPNAACAGAFYDLIKTGEYPVYSWTCLDNPHLPDVEAFLTDMAKQLGGRGNPTFIREYLGQWVRDTAGLVFSLHPGSIVPAFPSADADDWEYVLGVDLGWRATAFVVLAFSPTLEKVYVVESSVFAKLKTARIAATIERYTRQYNLYRVVVDAGGFGRTMAEDLQSTYGLPVTFAKKTKKAAGIERINSDLGAGVFHIVEEGNSDLVEEVKILQWDGDKLAQNRFEFDDGFQDHLSDAMLYGYRECRHHDEDWETNAPVYGTDAWFQAREDEIIARLEEKVNQPKDPVEWFR